MNLDEQLRITCVELALITLKEFTPSIHTTTEELGNRVVTVATVIETYILGLKSKDETKNG